MDVERSYDDSNGSHPALDLTLAGPGAFGAPPPTAFEAPTGATSETLLLLPEAYPWKPSLSVAPPPMAEDEAACVMQGAEEEEHPLLQPGWQNGASLSLLEEGEAEAPPPPPLPPLATPEQLSALAGDVVTLPAEQWRSMQAQLAEMEQRQRELLSALGSVTDHSNKTITSLQVRKGGGRAVRSGCNDVKKGRTVIEDAILIHTGLSHHLPGADACSWTRGHSNKAPPLPRLPSPLQERAHNLEEQDSRPPLRSASRCTPASSHTALPPPHPTGACAQP